MIPWDENKRLTKGDYNSSWGDIIITIHWERCVWDSVGFQLGFGLYFGRNRGRIPAPGIKGTFKYAICAFLFSHCGTSATTARRLICTPRLFFQLTSLWQFGPFPRWELALITLCSVFGLKAVVLLSSISQSLTPCHAMVCSLISPVHKAPAIHSQHVVSKSVEVPTCPHN